MRKLKHTPSLESEDVLLDNIAEPGDDPTLAADIVEDQAEHAEFDQCQQEAAAQEKLEQVQSMVQTIITEDKATEETLQLVEEAVGPAMEALGVDIATPSLESMEGMSIKQRHQIALETIGEAIRVFNQTNELNQKQKQDDFWDIFKTKAGEIEKYKGQLNATLKMYNAKKPKFRDGKQRLDLSGLFRFFNTRQGQVSDLINDVKDDLKTVNYSLIRHAQDTIDALSGLKSQLAKKPKDVKGFQAMFEAIGLIQSPVDEFPSNLLGTKANMLGHARLDIVVGTKRKTLSLAGKSYPKLSANATAKLVKEGTFSLNLVKRVMVDNEIHPLVTPKVDYVESDVPIMIKHGLEYLDQAEKYLSFGPTYKRVCEEIEENFVECARNAKSLPESKEILALMKQVEQVYKNFAQNFKSPAKAELRRVIMGGRYCDYAAQHMVKNLTRWFK